MNLQELQTRANHQCELCKSKENLHAYTVSPREDEVLLCDVCEQNLNEPDQKHWQCLNESIWSEVPAVQALSYRILKTNENESFARDILDIAYLEEDIQAWAMDGVSKKSTTKDSNGVILNQGDSVSIIKDLEVKGAGFTAKRGTTVKNISLTDNDEQVEGRVNGVKIVLLSKFLKKL